VVGLGTQDSFEEAEEFRDRHGTITPLMIWDESFETWNHYEISSQPAAVLLDAQGEELGRWRGLPDEVYRLADSL
jgi:hypothetical protein